MPQLLFFLCWRVVLGSSSPYRREQLSRQNVPIGVDQANVDESPRAHESPRELALRLALAKAHAVAQHHADAAVIGSDQVADLDGEPLGKPGTHERACDQLRRMSGKVVIFQT